MLVVNSSLPDSITFPLEFENYGPKAIKSFLKGVLRKESIENDINEAICAKAFAEETRIKELLKLNNIQVSFEEVCGYSDSINLITVNCDDSKKIGNFLDPIS